MLRDGWGHVEWYRSHDVGFASLRDELVWGWRYNNPRPGQILTLLAYAPGPWHVVFTPLAELGLFILLATLVLGRWPSPRRLDDLLLFVMIVALVGVCSPYFGPMLFYRPVTGNYTHTFALSLLWLVPYRFALESPRPQRLGAAPLMLGFGFVAGFCNEHTGPAIAAAAAAATVACWRRDGVRIWMIAGIVGFAAGFALLIFAPGQSHRYDGLAAQTSIVERIADRGLVANLALVGRPVLAMWPALPALALGVAALFVAKPAPLPTAERSSLEAGPLGSMTRGRRVLAALALAGVVTAVTVLASPKIGHRLFFAATALWCCAIAGWVTPRLAGKLRAIGAALAGGTLAFVVAMLVVTYSEVGPVGETRFAAITDSAPGATVHVQRYPVDGNHWFLGEDLDVDDLRFNLVQAYNLKAIELDRK